MDQKRLFLAIAISVAILLGFQFLMPHPAVPPPVGRRRARAAPAKPPGSAASRARPGRRSRDRRGEYSAEDCATGADRCTERGWVDQPAGRADR